MTHLTRQRFFELKRRREFIGPDATAMTLDIADVDALLEAADWLLGRGDTPPDPDDRGTTD